MPAVLLGCECGGTNDDLSRPIAIESLTRHEHADCLVEREPALHHECERDQVGWGGGGTRHVQAVALAPQRLTATATVRPSRERATQA